MSSIYGLRVLGNNPQAEAYSEDTMLGVGP